MAKNNVLEKFRKISDNNYAFVLSKENNLYSIKSYIDTKCLILNTALSGDPLKGLPKGKRVSIAGPSGTAKSYFTLYMVKAFLEQGPNSYVFAFESEGAEILSMTEDIGISGEMRDRIIVLPVSTVEDFRIQSTKILDSIKKERFGYQDGKTKVKPLPEQNEYMFFLDSLGMLASSAEINHALAGESKVDMTRAKIIRSIFRNITLDLSLCEVPFIIVNHTMQTLEKFSRLEQTGGDGIRYSCDVSLVLTKAKEKEGTEHVGHVISLHVNKSRFIPENSCFKILMSFKKGLYKYSSMIEHAIEFGLVEKVSKGKNGSFLIFEGTTEVSLKDYIKDSKKYMTDEFLIKLSEKIKSKYSFGNGDSITDDDEDSFVSEIDTDEEYESTDE
jgi:RecA/RadA recombinase